MKVLWLYTNTLSEVMLYDSLACTGEYEIHKLDYFDAIAHHDKLTSYDRVVVNCAPDYDRGRQSAELRFFRSLAPTVFLHFEASEPPFSKCHWVQDEGHDVLIVNIDGNPNWRNSDKGLTVLTPIDPKYYFPHTPWAERPITAGTSCGNANPIRSSVLNALADCLTWRGPDPSPDTTRTYADYANFVKNCRATFNLSEHGPGGGGHHVKGRVIEAALGGSLLLEQKQAPTPNWFEPGVDFLQWESVDHARELIARVDVDPECEKMARRLHERVMAEHHPTVVWRKVFAAL